MNLEPEIPEVLNKWPKYFNIKKKFLVTLMKACRH